MCLQYVFQSNADVAVNIPFSLFFFFFEHHSRFLQKYVAGKCTSAFLFNIDLKKKGRGERGMREIKLFFNARIMI